MKCFSLFAVFLFIAVCQAQAQEPAAPAAGNVDPECDRILNTMVSGAAQLRERLTSAKSNEPKVICCDHFRFNMALQSVKAYATVAKATRICADSVYDTKISDLEGGSVLLAVRSTCEKFETQTCITEPVSNAWNTAVSSVQSNVNLDQISQQIGANWNSAMSSLSNIAKNLGDQINQQNITGRLQESASVLQSQLRERTKQLTDMVSGQGANRYSLVGGEGDALSLDSIVHSVIPDVEIVEVKPNGAPAAAPVPVPATPTAAGGSPSKRFNFMDWFGSLTNGINLGPTDGSGGQQKQTFEQRGNPYTS